MLNSTSHLLALHWSPLFKLARVNFPSSFVAVAFILMSLVFVLGLTGNELPVFRYWERFDWFCFHYEGFWCSSLAVSFTWPLLNEVLCLDVIEGRILAGSSWNPTLALSVTYHVALGKSLTLCDLCLLGWRMWFLPCPLQTEGSGPSGSQTRLQVLRDSALLLHLHFLPSSRSYSVT